MPTVTFGIAGSGAWWARALGLGQVYMVLLLSQFLHEGHVLRQAQDERGGYPRMGTNFH